MGEGQAALSGSRRFPLGDYKSTMRLSRGAVAGGRR